jgi:hypothetical protein
MVHSSTLAVATDGERLTSGNFSLSETVPFGSLDFITDCFGDLSLSPKGGGGGDSSAIFVGTTRNGGDSSAIFVGTPDKFYTTSSGEGSSGLPVP